MVIVTADDSALALEMLNDAVTEACPDAELHSFKKASEVIEFVSEHECQVAFLDIHLRGMDGVELARKLKELCPKINVIFVTGYNKYAYDALEMRASGYVMKPVTTERIRDELANLRNPIVEPEVNKLKVQCFGNFEVFDQSGKAVRFERAKAKELFAYLIHRKGNTCTIREMAGILFEEQEYDRSRQAYIQTIIASLNKTLKNYNVQNVLVKGYNSLAIKTDLLECDYYKFLENDESSIRAYMGEYMAQYSWGEFVLGYLDRRAERY